MRADGREGGREGTAIKMLPQTECIGRGKENNSQYLMWNEIEVECLVLQYEGI